MLLCWQLNSFAQEALIKGQVKSEDILLEKATVVIESKTMLTNSLGEFSISVKAGTYIITITHVGYNTIEENLTLSAGESKFLEFNMTRNELLGEVVVLSSRSSIQRSNLSTPVPVDVITSNTLKQTGQQTTIQMMNFSLPSFNASRQNVWEPVTLRGLEPDHLLILLNDTRFHNSFYVNTGAIKGVLGRGAVTNDLNAIPFSAIDKIEILRDGATAQYGSDAIGGVMNVRLKETSGITSISLHLGQQYKGDGESLLFGINHGVKINTKGFVNFSGDFRYREPTHRGGYYLGTVYYNIPANATPSQRQSILDQDNSKIQQRGFDRKTPVSNDGNILTSSGDFLINSGYQVSKKATLHFTAGVNYRHADYPGMYRFPKNTSQVNTFLFPNGFKSRAIINTLDISIIAGAKGKTNGGWNWEWNSTFGENRSEQIAKNTNNASQQFTLGDKAPTEFYTGTPVYIQQTNALSFSKKLATKLHSLKSFNLAFGAEHRFEQVHTFTGEEASWANYDTTGKTNGGIQGQVAISPNDSVNEKRNVIGIYTDIETDINDHLLIDAAARFEHYGSFGGHLAGKLAMRYKFSRFLSLRGSVSNGYHAPALQQIYLNSVSSSWKDVGGVRIPTRLGLFSNKTEVAKAFGVKPLQAEKALNLGIGFTSSISSHISMTIDAYWIQIKNRIVLSGRFDRSNPDVNRILQNYPDIDAVQFITNAINTKTRGLDIVMNGNWKIRKVNLGFTLAANFTQTNIFGPVQLADSLESNTRNTNILFNVEEQEKIEHSQPGSKIILSTTVSKGKFGFVFRNTRFGNTSTTTLFVNPIDTLHEFLSPKILTDININYTPKSWLTITVGANNVFNVYPDRLKNYRNTNEGMLIYGNEAMPFGYNGGYYYVNMSFNF